MERRLRVVAVILVLAAGAIAIYVAHAYGALDLGTFIASCIGEAVVAGLGYLFGIHPVETRHSPPKEDKRTTFELTPLPDYAGWLTDPSPPKVVENPDGTKSSTFVNDMRATTPEFALLARSQQWWAGYGPADKPLKIVRVKFGVIRVKAKDGPGLNCHAELSYRRSPTLPWVPLGNLNWFSIALKEASQRRVEEIDKSLWNGLNQYLKNPTETFYEGEERDLLLTYMIMGQSSVFLCIDTGHGTIGYVTGSESMIFEVEIGIAAENVPRVAHRFIVATHWDYCKIQRSNS